MNDSLINSLAQRVATADELEPVSVDGELPSFDIDLSLDPLLATSSPTTVLASLAIDQDTPNLRDDSLNQLFDKLSDDTFKVRRMASAEFLERAKNEEMRAEAIKILQDGLQADSTPLEAKFRSQKILKILRLPVVVSWVGLKEDLVKQLRTHEQAELLKDTTEEIFGSYSRNDTAKLDGIAINREILNSQIQKINDAFDTATTEQSIILSNNRRALQEEVDTLSAQARKIHLAAVQTAGFTLSSDGRTKFALIGERGDTKIRVIPIGNELLIDVADSATSDINQERAKEVFPHIEFADGVSDQTKNQYGLMVPTVLPNGQLVSEVRENIYISVRSTLKVGVTSEARLSVPTIYFLGGKTPKIFHSSVDDQKSVFDWKSIERVKIKSDKPTLSSERAALTEEQIKSSIDIPLPSSR